MTCEELRETIFNMESGLKTISKNDYVSFKKNVVESILQNYKELLQLKEKQIPIKPVSTGVGRLYTCPHCLCLIEKKTEIHPANAKIEGLKIDISNCPFCGQAIDWSDSRD